MNKAFEKIIEKLEELQNNLLLQTEGDIDLQVGVINGVMYSRKIVQEVAEEYNNGWISCSDRLPEYAESLVNCTIKRLSDGHVWVQNLIYNRIDDKWKWTDYPEDICVDMDSFTILSWQPLPEPYKEGE